MQLVIRGTRGSLPVCRPDCLRHGGCTTCFSLQTADGLLVIDAGTGLARTAVGGARGAAGEPVTILFTHLHMDHLLGLPMFAPLFDPNERVTLMADPRRDEDWKAALLAFTGKPFWPVGLGDCRAKLRMLDLPVAAGELTLSGARVTWFSVPHPQQCLAYRIEVGAFAAVIATDVEYRPDAIDPAFARFCEAADVLIMDAQYLPAEYPAHRGWGHSTWEACVAAAKTAGVGRLVLTHHAPGRSDRDVEAIATEASAAFPATVAARDGMAVPAG